MNMRKKPGQPFELVFQKADRAALALLKRMLAFDPAERPTSEEALADPYFTGLSQITREPSAQPVSKLAFEFERKKLTTDEVIFLLNSSFHSLVAGRTRSCLRYPRSELRPLFGPLEVIV